MSLYRDSQKFIDEAEAALRAGDGPRARVAWREAARLQRAFVDALPPERVQSKSIFGLSAATLLERAGDSKEAEQLARQLLAEPWIDGDAASKLRRLLEGIRPESTLEEQHVAALVAVGTRP